MRKITITFTFLFISILFVSFLNGCRRHESEVHLKVETKIKEILEENKYKDYKSIIYSPLYAFTVVEKDQEAFKEILLQNVSDREIEEFIDNNEELYNSPLEQEAIEKTARDILADKWIQIIAMFTLGSAPIQADIYKEVIYRDQIIRNNKLIPKSYVVFHKFSYKDKYNESYTEYVGALVDSANCNLQGISRDVKLLIDAK